MPENTDDYDSNEPIGLTQIAWTKAQKKNLKLGFFFLALVIMGVIALSVWFFSHDYVRIIPR